MTSYCKSFKRHYSMKCSVWLEISMVAFGTTVKPGCARSRGRTGVVTNNNGQRFLCEPDRSCHHVTWASGRTRSNLKGTKRNNHQLLSATLAFKVHKTKVKEDSVRRINVTKLKVAQTKAAVQLKFRNWFPALEEESVGPSLAVSTRHWEKRERKILGIQKVEEGTWNMRQDHRKKTDQEINSTWSESLEIAKGLGRPWCEENRSNRSRRDLS